MALSRSRLVAILIICMLAVARASAQQPPSTQPNRPTQGFFQGDRQDAQSRESLLLNGSLMGSYDDNVINANDAGAALDPRFRMGGLYSRGDVRLFYTKKLQQVQFASSGSAAVDYYPGLDSLTQGSYWGGAGVAAPFRRTTLRATQDITYSPYLALGAFPILEGLDAKSVVLNGFALFAIPAITYATSARIDQRVGRRSSISATYDVNVTDFRNKWTNLSNQATGARINIPIGRLNAVQGSYSYRTASYDVLNADNAATRGHDLDAGYTYTRRLSATRQVGLGGGGGSSIYEATSISTTGKNKFHRVIGYGSFGYDFARTWGTRSEFRRSLQVIPGAAQPFFGNGLTFTLGGGLSRRTDIIGTAQYSQGELGVGLGSNGYTARVMSVRFRYALSRQLAFSTEYTYYAYDFSETADLPPNVPPGMNRQAIRFGLTFGTSLLHRQPRP